VSKPATGMTRVVHYSCFWVGVTRSKPGSMQMMNGQIISHQFGDGRAGAKTQQLCGVGSFVEVVEQVLDLWAGV
jgi:hypothetical protein